MRSVVALALLMLASGCHRRRASAPRVRDPRQEYGTGCVDPRYVTAPSAVVATAPAGALRQVETAARCGVRAVAWCDGATVSVAIEGREPVRVVEGGTTGHFAMASTNGRYLVAWRDGEGNVRVATVDASASVTTGEVLARGVTGVAMAGTTQGALVVWTTGMGRVMAQRLGREGAKVGEAIPVAIDGGDEPAVTWTGMRWVVAWRRARRAIEARMVNADGSLETASFTVVPEGEGEVGAPTVAWGGARLAVAWSDRRNGDLALQVTSVDLRGRRLADPQRLSTRFAEGARASLAWDGAAWGAVWCEPVGGGAPRTYMALVDRTGRRIGSPMRVHTGDELPTTEPVLAWERPDYFIAMVREGARVEALRTGPRGCDMPPAPRVDSAGACL